MIVFALFVILRQINVMTILVQSACECSTTDARMFDKILIFVDYFDINLNNLKVVMVSHILDHSVLV